MAGADDVRRLALALPGVAEIDSGLFFTTPGHEGWPRVMLRLAKAGTERLTNWSPAPGGCAPPPLSPANWARPDHKLTV